jgi:hypothetical protein
MNNGFIGQMMFERAQNLIRGGQSRKEFGPT